mmetsp:Transcript_30801/g.100292  ORF Transcript_30801/g.100292 Transcript_30801/m.100292 type:complete len:210 (+) Transcript_30801:987-1616(+)
MLAVHAGAAAFSGDRERRVFVAALRVAPEARAERISRAAPQARDARPELLRPACRSPPAAVRERQAPPRARHGGARARRRAAPPERRCPRRGVPSTAGAAPAPLSRNRQPQHEPAPLRAPAVGGAPPRLLQSAARARQPAPARRTLAREVLGLARRTLRPRRVARRQRYARRVRAPLQSEGRRAVPGVLGDARHRQVRVWKRVMERGSA